MSTSICKHYERRELNFYEKKLLTQYHLLELCKKVLAFNLQITIYLINATINNRFLLEFSQLLFCQSMFFYVINSFNCMTYCLTLLFFIFYELKKYDTDYLIRKLNFSGEILI